MCDPTHADDETVSMNPPQRAKTLAEDPGDGVPEMKEDARRWREV
jgi:hypothetical protein